MDTSEKDTDERLVGVLLALVLGGGLIVAILISIALAPFALLFGPGSGGSGGGPCALASGTAHPTTTLSTDPAALISSQSTGALTQPAASSAYRLTSMRSSPASLSLRGIVWHTGKIPNAGIGWYQLSSAWFARESGGVGGVGNDGAPARLPAFADGCLL